MAIFDITYVGDMPYLKLEGGTVTGATIFNSSVTANSGSITNNLAVGSINGVTVGQNPKFTDTTYSVATTSVAGLMSTTDKTAVDKVGTGTLNTTNKTIIPAINELKSTDSSLTTRITTIENKINTTPSTTPPAVRRVYIPADKTSWTLGSKSISSAAGGWDNYSSITFTVVGEVGDTILIFAVAGGTRNITVSSGFTELSSSANNQYYPHAQFAKRKTAASETVTVNMSGSPSSYYEDFVTVVVIKGYYAIEYAAKTTSTLTINKPHQGYYIYSSRRDNGLTGLDQITQLKSSSGNSTNTYVYFDNDSTNKTVGPGGSPSSDSFVVAICLQETGDWSGGELPVGAYFSTEGTTSSYNPNKILGYGTWQYDSSYYPYWWKRTS